MATFKFNFELEGKQGVESKALHEEDKSISTVEAESIQQSVKASRAREIPITELHWTNSQYVSAPYVYLVPHSNLQLYYINRLDHSGMESISHILEAGVDLDTFLESEDQVTSEFETPNFKQLCKKQHSDLIPGVYEGGLKVWDGAVDLIRYFIDSNFEFSGTKVLELGCGVGLPGICALIRGADHVSFQDYNFEVINYATIPSVLYNLINESGGKVIVGLGYPMEMKHGVLKKCKFYSGDWSHFTDLLTSHSCDHYYDVIITSETIYSVASQPKLLSAIKRLLDPKRGVAFVAAKTYYFGVGGTMRAFEELIKKDGYFIVTEVKALPTSVPRKIIKLVPSQT